MFSDLLFRLRSHFQRKAVESELDHELRFHLEQQIEEFVKSGLSREEARACSPWRSEMRIAAPYVDRRS